MAIELLSEEEESKNRLERLLTFSFIERKLMELGSWERRSLVEGKVDLEVMYSVAKVFGFEEKMKGLFIEVGGKVSGDVYDRLFRIIEVAKESNLLKANEGKNYWNKVGYILNLLRLEGIEKVGIVDVSPLGVEEEILEEVGWEMDGDWLVVGDDETDEGLW